MNASKKVVLIASLACVAGLGALRWEALRLRTTRAEIAAWRARLADERAQMQSLQDRLAALRRDEKPAKDQSAPSDPAVASAGAGQGSAEAIRRQAVKDRAKLNLQYLPLYNALHLTNEQSARVTAAFADFMSRRADILIAAGAQGLTRADPTIDAMILKENAELKDEIAAVIGQDGLQQWLDYRRSAPVRGFEASLASNLYYTSTPLTPQQADLLTPQLAQLSSKYGTDRGTYDLETMDPAKLQAVAGTVLSGPQLEVLDNRLVAQQIENQMDAYVTAWRQAHAAGTGSNP